MEQTIQEIQDNLKSITMQRKQTEESLDFLQNEFSSIQKRIEDTLENLQLLKDQESSLQNKLYLAQKESIKEALSVQNIKKIFSDSNPFVKKIKEKSKEIKEALDGTAFDRQWIDEQYEKYKESCIKKGEEIKSKDEFKAVAITIKDVKHEAEDVKNQFGELLNKAGNKFKKVSDFFQEALAENQQEVISNEKSLPIENKPVVIEEIILPSSKKEGLELWVKKNHIKYVEESVSLQYVEYVKYLNEVFGGEAPKDLIYSSKGGAFKLALKKFIGL